MALLGYGHRIGTLMCLCPWPPYFQSGNLSRWFLFISWTDMDGQDDEKNQMSVSMPSSSLVLCTVMERLLGMARSREGWPQAATVPLCFWKLLPILHHIRNLISFTIIIYSLQIRPLTTTEVKLLSAELLARKCALGSVMTAKPLEASVFSHQRLSECLAQR